MSLNFTMNIQNKKKVDAFYSSKQTQTLTFQ